MLLSLEEFIRAQVSVGVAFCVDSQPEIAIFRSCYSSSLKCNWKLMDATNDKKKIVKLNTQLWLLNELLLSVV